jgi:hypothetical protein
MAATVVVVAAVARAAASARQILDHGAVDPPRHRADRPSVGPATHVTPPASTVSAPPRYHAFGPEPCILPARGAGNRGTAVTELEASGELDDQPTPTDRLFARRHAGDPVEIRPD